MRDLFTDFIGAHCSLERSRGTLGAASLRDQSRRVAESLVSLENQRHGQDESRQISLYRPEHGRRGGL